MRRRVAGFAALGVLVALVVFALRPVREPFKRRAVIGGGAFPLAGEYPYIALLYGAKGTRKSLCSGALVDPLHVVTAWHCVDRGSAAVGSQALIGPLALNKSLMPDGKLPPAELRTIKSAQIKNGPMPPPNAPDFVPSDWALIELDAPVKASPLRVDGWQVALNPSDLPKSNVWAVGFGQTENGTLGRLQDAPVKVESSPQGIRTLGSQAPTGPCHGDSGGPLVVKFPNRIDVTTGIASSVTGTDCTKPHRSNWVPLRPVAENMKKSWSPATLTQRLAKCKLENRQGTKCPATHPWDSGGIPGPKAPAGPLAGKYCAETAECAIDLFRLFVKNGAAATVAKYTQ